MSAPFPYLPGGAEIARYFWHEIVKGDIEGRPYGPGEYHGVDGILLWSDGKKYSSLRVEATVDHDMWKSYLLEIRTKMDGKETRDYLFLHAGVDDTFEVEWHNHAITFNAPVDVHIDHLYLGLKWFTERVVGAIERHGERSRGGNGW